MDRAARMLPFSNRDGKFSFKTMFSYIFDYLIIVILAIIYGALDKIVTPFAQRFSLTDISIQYPYAFKERVPIAEALAISGGFPLVVIAVYTLVLDGLFSHSKQKGLRKYTFPQRLWELNCGVLGLFLAQGAAFCITGTLKNLVGRPRPDLISRCLPQDGAHDQAIFGLSTKAICTQQDFGIMQDAFRSFPSGHSSSSFAGLGYLSLYLAGKLHVLDQRGEVWRTVIVVIPPIAASCIAASRIMDYRHHYTDVLFGSILGLLCAWAAYRQYFPALKDIRMKGRAYPMREWGVPLSKHDEEYQGPAYTSGRYDRTADVMEAHGPATEIPFHNRYTAQDTEEHQMYGLEPIRPPPVRTDVPSSGFSDVTTSRQSPQGEDTDYEMIRPKAQGVSVPTQAISRQGTGGQNVFREQVMRNQSRRRPGSGHNSDDEEDIGSGNNRSLLV